MIKAIGFFLEIVCVEGRGRGREREKEEGGRVKSLFFV